MLFVIIVMVVIISGELQGDSNINEFQHIFMGKHPQADEALPLHSKEDFVGNMEQFKFNGNNFFESLARTGNHDSIESTAEFDKKNNVVNFPVTFKSPSAFLTTRLELYSTFTVHLQVKTTQPDGLILYSGGGSGKDFISLELVNGYMQYSFDVGSGPRVIESSLQQPINDNKWHDIAVLRPAVLQTILRVDDRAAIDNLPSDKSVHFDTNDVLYIGGVPRDMYKNLPKQILSSLGYQGCLGSIDLNGDNRNILEQRATIPDEYRNLVSQGCDGKSFSI